MAQEHVKSSRTQGARVNSLFCARKVMMNYRGTLSILSRCAAVSCGWPVVREYYFSLLLCGWPPSYPRAAGRAPVAPGNTPALISWDPSRLGPLSRGGQLRSQESMACCRPLLMRVHRAGRDHGVTCLVRRLHGYLTSLKHRSDRELVIFREQRQLQSARYSGLIEDVGQVMLDRVFTDLQALSHVAV